MSKEFTMEKNTPIKTFRAGTVQVSVWEHKGDGEDVRQSFTFQKSYKDDKEVWQQTQSLFSTDIPKLVLALKEAYKDNMLKV